MTQDIPSVTFNALPHADGSVEYGHAGYTILATVNGPIEPQRRDELPEEAFLEVHVREASGSGGRSFYYQRRIYSFDILACL